MSHVTHMNESCHTRKRVISHKWMNLIAHMDESCHTYDWVMSYIWMSHVTHTNESYHTYEWGMSHIWMSHVTHTNESCHTYEWGMSHIGFRICMATHKIPPLPPLCPWQDFIFYSRNKNKNKKTTDPTAEEEESCESPCRFENRCGTWLIHMWHG